MKSFLKNIDKKQACFLLICFSTYCLWSLNIPFNAAPDEYMRMDLVSFMLQNNRLPTGYDESIRNYMWGFSYAYLPFLPQIISAAFCKFFMFLSVPENLLYLVSRLPGVIFSTLSVYFCLKIGQKLFITNFKWMFAAIVAFLPQFVFLSAYINNESLAFLGVSGAVYAWLCGEKSGWNVKSCVGLAVALSACFLSYYNSYGFIVFSVPLFILTYIKYYNASSLDSKQKLDEFCKKALLIIGICAALAGWWFIRNHMLYNDMFGLEAMDKSCEMYALDKLKPSNQVHSKSLHEMFFDMNWILITTGSFIGAFGYANKFLARWLYVLYIGGACIGVVGNLFFFLNKKERKTTLIFSASLWLAALTSVVLSIYNSYTGDFQPQGRYVIYMILPISLAVTRGFESMSAMRRRSKGVRAVWPYVICSLYVAVNYFVFFRYII